MWLLLMACSREPTLAEALQFYSQQPEYLRPFPLSPVPAGLTSIRAEECGACHKEIYEEWKISTHSKAWEKDPQFMAELHKERPDGGDVGWMCVNCHTPLIQQLPRLVVSVQNSLDNPTYMNNPLYDADLQKEAISCAGCHVLDGVILGPRGERSAPHPVKKSEYLLTSDVCLDCHQAKVSFDDLNLACVFNTGKELEQGPYKDQTCQSCHMPKTHRALISGGEERMVRRHYFGGSLIPKQFSDEKEIAQMTPYFKQGLEVEELQIQQDRRDIVTRIVYRNANAGHYLPTGDPERFLLFVFKITDESGTVLLQEEMRIASQYQWWPTVQLLSDNRLAPLEEREWEIPWTAPVDAVYNLELEIEKWRISQENLEYHRLEKIVPSHTSIFRKRAQIEVKQRNEK